MKSGKLKKMQSKNIEGIRINKYLSSHGICSRRQADRLIEEGKVKVDGKVVDLGFCVVEGQAVEVDGVRVTERPEPLYFKYFKPKGVVCTTADFDKHNIVDAIGYEERIYPVGRLDKDSTGLILLTNDGSIVNPILKASNVHEKEYEVEVRNRIPEDALDRMRRGVEILDTVTRPCIIRRTGPKTFRIIITQGLNRQIRRMCEAVGHEVVKLHRIRILDIPIGDLKEGELRALTSEEIRSIMDCKAEAEKKQSMKESPAVRRMQNEDMAGSGRGSGKSAPEERMRTSGNKQSSGRRKSGSKKPFISGKNGELFSGKQGRPFKHGDRKRAGRKTGSGNGKKGRKS